MKDDKILNIALTLCIVVFVISVAAIAWLIW